MTAARKPCLCMLRIPGMRVKRNRYFAAIIRASAGRVFPPSVLLPSRHRSLSVDGEPLGRCKRGGISGVIWRRVACFGGYGICFFPRRGESMRKAICTGASFVALLVLCACFFPAQTGGAGEKVAEESGAYVTVYDVSAERLERVALEEYVGGVVAAEMPSEYHEEALKAQAVAARTFALFKSPANGGGGCVRHPGADVCSSASCCQGYLTEARARERLGERAEAAMEAGRRAAESTAGEVLMFRGHLIRALYHACAGGHTENAENVYSSAIAYLRGVSSPGEEEYPQYSYTTEIPMAAIQEALADREDVLLLDELAPEDQLEVIERSETGRVTRIRVGLTALTGTEFRRALGLRSTNFEMEFSGKTVIFRTVGYGHGVGMSQTGADAMAARGAGYDEILAWYYTGAELKVPAGVAV